MQGFKEMLAATLFSVAAFISLAAVTEHGPSRKLAPEEPVTVTGDTLEKSHGVEERLNWGLSAIRAAQAQQRSKGEDITVAIIDTGCDIHHPELAPNIWSNPGENGVDDEGQNRATNGIDDDGNGFVDDAHGWDFVSNTPAVMDEHGHGTHIAGIVGGVRDGVAPRVSLMILKYYDTESDGLTNLRNSVAAIRYAVRMGARIINYSGGGIVRDRGEEEALAWAAARGVLVVAAAGNEGVNSDFFHFYPADYQLPNIISVAAVDRRGHLIAASNFGAATVSVAAPGRNIHSTLPGGSHGYMTGTSQATAFVTGVAALLMAHHEGLRDPAALIAHLKAHGRPRVALRDKVGPAQLIDADALTRGAPGLRLARTPSRAARAN